MDNETPDEEGQYPHRWEAPEWTQWGQRVRVRRSSEIEHLVSPPIWVTEEVSRELDRIQRGDLRKRRNTIILVADALASGAQKVGDVFPLDHTVNQASWYADVLSDPLVRDVYNFCLKAAHHYYDRIEARRIEARGDQITQSRDELLALTSDAIQVLGDILVNPRVSAHIRRQAAVEVLDRASEHTAAKETSHHEHVVRPGAPTMSDIRQRRRQRGQPREPEALEGQALALPLPDDAAEPDEEYDDLDRQGVPVEWVVPDEVEDGG